MLFLINTIPVVFCYCFKLKAGSLAIEEVLFEPFAAVWFVHGAVVTLTVAADVCLVLIVPLVVADVVEPVAVQLTSTLQDVSHVHNTTVQKQMYCVDNKEAIIVTQFVNFSLSYAQSSDYHAIFNNWSLFAPSQCRSSSFAALSLPPTVSSLKTKDCSCRSASLFIWNQLYFVSLTSLVMIHHIMHLSSHLWHRHHSQHQLVPCFTLQA